MKKTKRNDRNVVPPRDNNDSPEIMALLDEVFDTIEERPPKKKGFFRRIFKAKTPRKNDDEDVQPSTSAFKTEDIKDTDSVERKPRKKFSFLRKLFKTKSSNKRDEKKEKVIKKEGDEAQEIMKKSRIATRPLTPFKRARKYKNERVQLGEGPPEIKIATMESIQENEVFGQEIVDVVSSNETDNGESVTAEVTYQCEDGALSGPAIESSVATKIKFYPAKRNSFDCDLSYYLPDSEVFKESYYFHDPRWDIWPKLQNDYPRSISPPFEFPDNEENIIFTDDFEEPFFDSCSHHDIARHQQISNFFAEEARTLDDQDVNKYSDEIEIAELDIDEEDLKEYRAKSKQPDECEVIYNTVETALNFVKRYSLRQKEKTQNTVENQKEKANRIDPPKPKLWLVFNKFSNEKVVVCTPGDFV